MNRYDMLLRLKKFNEMELACREFFERTGGRYFTNPCTMDEVRLFLSKPEFKTSSISKLFSYNGLREDYLFEDTFIGENSDVAVLKHIRYLPSMLHSHAFIKIICVLEGRCVHSAGDTLIDLAKGDVCVVSPDVRQYTSAFDDETIVINILIRQSTFNTVFFELIADDDILSDFFTRILYGANKSIPYILFKCGDDKELRNLLIDLFIESGSTEKYRDRMVNLLLATFCTLLLRNHEKDVVVTNPIINAQDDRIVLALRYIETNYSNVNFNSVAKTFNYSEAHFSRLIKKYTGRTFSEIVRDIRVKKAAELFQNSSLTTSEIVERVGYTDVSHLYKNFKEYYGMTPMEYKNMKKSEKSGGKE